MQPAEKPIRLGRALLMTLAAGLLASLSVVYWPRSGGGVRPPGIYLVGGGTSYVEIGPGGTRFPVTGHPHPVHFGSGTDWKAFGGGKSLRVEHRSASASTPGYDDAVVLEFTASASRPGDYDLYIIRQERERSNRFFAFFENLWKARSAPMPVPTTPPVPGYLHRLDDPRVAEYFRIASKEPALSPRIGHDAVSTTMSAPALLAPPGPRSAELLSLAEGLVARYPEDLHVRILLLDALIRGRNSAEMEKRLDAWRTDFADAVTSDPMVSAAFAQAERQARGMALSASGRNGYETLVRALSPTTDLSSRLDLLATLLPLEDLIPPRPIAAGDFSVLNFLEIQVAAKTGRVEVTFELLRGRPDQARGLALSLYRLGQLIEEHDSYLITRLIGMAIRAIGSGGLELVALDGCETTSDSQALARQLDLLATFERETDTLKFMDGPVPLPVDTTVLAGAYLGEAATRHQVSNTKFQLVRTANAARYRLLADGRWPDPAHKNALAPLLPGGALRDPFSPTSAPISLLHDPTSETLTVYSVGPDKTDDRAAVDYDPTNGTLSWGDLAIRIPRERKYPFPKEAVRASTVAELERQFPQGLPVDLFADTRGRGLGIAQTTGPVYVYSYGPDTDESEATRAGAAYLPEVSYDPTNGTTSGGDLFLEIPAR